MEGELSQDFLSGLQLEEDLKSRDPYEWFMRNEPHLNLTPIEVDPENGLRFTTRSVGMVRGMREDHRTVMKVFLDPVPHVILDQNIPLRGWYKSKHEEAGRRPRPCMTEALLSQPYGGFCAVGCAFCYINHGLRGYRGQGLATVDPHYGEKIRRQISRMRLGAAVYMSSFIDPFLELEEIYHNTRDCSQAATDAGLPIFFLTRKLVPSWAFDHLKRSPYSYMQFSINTSDPETWRRLSPRAPDLQTMLDQVREMHRWGIYVSIQVNPIIPGVIPNADIEHLIHRLAGAGADHLIFKFIEISFPSVPALISQLAVRFGEDKAETFRSAFTCNIGGQRTVEEDYRKKALDRFSTVCLEAGVTMALCYEYEFERDEAGNVLRNRGQSMTPKYITSDQCHGHRIPLFYRRDLSQPFHPLEACPPAGCLTCGDTVGDERVPCGSSFLAHAHALEPSDYRELPNNFKVIE